MEESKIDIFISGDFAPQLRVNEVIKNKEFDKLYNDMLPLIKDANIAITNLESPLISEGTPIVKTGPNLKSPINSIHAIKYGGFTMVTLANNHIMDYGEEGLYSTIEICKKNNIDIVGAGSSLDNAKRIKYKECKGKRIAFINVAENEWGTTQGPEAGANPLDEVGVFYSIREAKQKADIIILIIHGGHETYELPSPRMKKLYRYFIDIGADAVVGHHTHCFSGHEVYKNKVIVYSLGNFIFDHLHNKNNTSWNKGTAVTLSISDTKVDFKLHPFYQCNETVGITLFNTTENDNFNKEVIVKMKKIQDDKLLQLEFERFINSQKRMYTSFLEPTRNKYILAAMNRGLLPRFIKGKKKNLLLNIIRCEAHRDIVEYILSEKTNK